MLLTMSHKYWKAHLLKTGTSLKVLKIQLIFVEEGFLTQTCYVRQVSMELIGFLDQHFCMKERNSSKFKVSNALIKMMIKLEKMRHFLESVQSRMA